MKLGDLSDLPEELLAQLSFNRKEPDRYEPEGEANFENIYRSYQETGNLSETARRFMISRQRASQIMKRGSKA